MRFDEFTLNEQSNRRRAVGRALEKFVHTSGRIADGTLEDKTEEKSSKEKRKVCVKKQLKPFSLALLFIN